MPYYRFNIRYIAKICHFTTAYRPTTIANRNIVFPTPSYHFRHEQHKAAHTNFMKYIYTITVESEDLMTSELIAEDLDAVFDPSGLDNKLRGVVTKISREKAKE